MNSDPVSRRVLLAIARHAVADAVGAAPPIFSFDAETPLLHERRGAFVTLTLRGRLRGCIGRVVPTEPLHVLVPEMARAAAVSDPRFSPLCADEFAHVGIEISLLSALRDSRPEDVDVGVHGLMVTARGHRGLLLPQVPLQFGWTREQYLSEVCEKAGLPAAAWRRAGVRLQVFSAEVFAEDDL